MLPEPVEELAKAIADDTTSGAHALALRSLEAYEGLGQAAGSSEDADVLHDRLVLAQPWMVAVRNASLLGRHLARKDRWSVLPNLRKRLEGARAEVAEAAARALEGTSSVVTVSYSSDVYEALLRVGEKAPDLEVTVCESRPLREGVKLARDLSDAGLRAVVVADAAGPGLVAEADAVLTGADALLRTGALVNKIGTLGLALACREFGVPFWPLLEALKVELEGDTRPWEPEDRPPEEMAENVNARNFYFERVDPRLVEEVVCDAGRMTPERLLRRFRTLEDQIRRYLD